MVDINIYQSRLLINLIDFVLTDKDVKNKLHVLSDACGYTLFQQECLEIELTNIKKELQK
jgi:hypothetical protein